MRKLNNHEEWRPHRSLWHIGAAVLALGLISGCAGTKVRDVSTMDSDDDARGIRYYEKAPFILVHADGKGGLTSQLLFIEDTTRKRSIRPFAVLSANNTELTFSNGTLTQSKAVIDETTVPVALVQAAQSAAVAATKLAILDSAGTSEPEVVEFPAPALYRFVKRRDGTMELRGGFAHEPGQNGTPMNIRITIPLPAPK